MLGWAFFGNQPWKELPLRLLRSTNVQLSLAVATLNFLLSCVLPSLPVGWPPRLSLPGINSLQKPTGLESTTNQSVASHRWARHAAPLQTNASSAQRHVQQISQDTVVPEPFSRAVRMYPHVFTAERHMP